MQVFEVHNHKELGNVGPEAGDIGGVSALVCGRVAVEPEIDQPVVVSGPGNGGFSAHG
ncbi:MAG TPA: hypothetical protein VFZ08_08480 [Terriglobia bacterium]|nr:hypothetical protein [Terriglobia bacterium]